MEYQIRKLNETAALAVLLPFAGLAAERNPNVIVIFTDDQGYQDVGCFGSPDIKTPHLDRMAAEGIRFTDFYVAAPVCTPSRAGLLTGKYPARFGMAKGVLFPDSEDGLDPAETTMAEMLKAKKYATACIGKWHLGHRDPFLPSAQGFDLYFGIPYSNDMWLAADLNIAENVCLTGGMTRERMETLKGDKKAGRGLVPLMRGGEVVEYPADQATLTKRYAEEAVRFIESHHEQPFFIYMAPAMPHVPLYASSAFKGKSAGGLYGDTIEEIDWAVGQILDCLRKNGLAEKTLVVFTSDNGPWLSKKKAGGNALPLRNGKGSVFEGGMRVPCIMSWPGTIPAGTVCNEPASTLDLFPTFAAMAGVPVDGPLDGADLSPLLRGEKLNRDFSLLYYLQNGSLAAIRSGEWKLILSVPVTGYSQSVETKKYKAASFEPELYNLRDDIGEKNNLATVYPERVEQLLERARKEAARIR